MTDSKKLTLESFVDKYIIPNDILETIKGFPECHKAVQTSIINKICENNKFLKIAKHKLMNLAKDNSDKNYETLFKDNDDFNDDLREMLIEHSIYPPLGNSYITSYIDVTEQELKEFTIAFANYFNN